MKETFFISTAIPYVNAEPHLGFAFEIIQADVIARYYRFKGDDVFFLTGTDENALKNVLSAKEAGMNTEKFVDQNAEKFKDLKAILNLSWDDFIRTTEDRHFKGAKKLWSACSDVIYKKQFRGIYCIGCEEFKTIKDLVYAPPEGLSKELKERKDLEYFFCSEHPKIRLEFFGEENYFFKLSQYQKDLENLIQSNKLEIIPATKRNEMLSFINQGLQDFSISRTIERSQGWGIPVPGDPQQVQYVWFDALSNYINALGYAEDAEKFKHYWQNNNSIVHVIGKGASRFHAIYWPAILLAAGIALPKKIFIHGYLTINGQKISKSLGNVISPKEVVDKYGVDAVRYYLLREISSFEDGDFSYQKFKDRYNGDLANGLGNFSARILALGRKYLDKENQEVENVDIVRAIEKAEAAVEQKIREFKLHEAIAAVWELIGFGDRYLNEHEPWHTGDKRIIFNAVFLLVRLAEILRPFLPDTSEKLRQSVSIQNGKIDIQKSGILFPRLS